jgi:class 3 adenylate cyclase/TolB-like protein
MAEENVTHQLAAIVYADVSGYSRLTEADEIGTHRQLSASLDLIADRIRNAAGEVVHYAGDAVLARFQSVVAATNCAIGIQNAIGTLCAELAEDKRLLFRIGINLGEVIVDRNDIYGDGVNVAARLESLAVPGGICISEFVFQQVQDKVDAQFEDIGEQKLKNIERPVQVYRIVPESDSSSDNVLRISRFSRITGPGTEEAIADVFVRAEPPAIMILPFKNLSGSTDQDALVDGFRLSIQSSLVKLSGLFLINAPASEHYRHSDISAIQAGNEAGVRYVLEGAVQMSGDRVRVTIQLTDAPAAQIMWAESYDRVVDNIFEIQDEITTEVAVALDVKLLSGEEALVWWDGLPDRTARELVLRGMSHLYMGSENGNAIARSNFEELNKICPDSPQALALMAFTNWVDVMRGWSSEPDQSMERAVTLAEKAVELGDPDGFGRIVLGSVRLFQGRHDEALALSEEAVSVRTSCPLARAVRSNVLHFNGQHDRAIKNVKTAVKHARIYPPWMANVLSASYRDSGQIAPSVAVANECLRLEPENLDAHVLLCTDYSMSNSADDARRVAQEILSIKPAFSISAYIETQPYKDSRTLEGIVGALREAGLPD